MAQILTPVQKKALKIISSTPLSHNFYFSGGTALAHFFLQHRFSEDLDFFCKEEFDPQSVSAILRSIKPILGYEAIDYQQSFNRNLFFLHFKDKSVLKLEFTYYPFTQIEPPKLIEGLLVDSLIDITANKLFTIYQNPRGRDYYDLYYINLKHQLEFDKIRMLAKQKFDWHVDPLQLASRLYQVDRYFDDPILTDKISRQQIIDYFQIQAKTLENEIVYEP